ncbi:hypothetical protein BDF20DRAFT_471878 [Mycotypha africana]|uniref:uncharacterized protein n=1 Tax=Mycotypha africana TaxID=64632 RepID=UPI002301920B|nr:uncharacterized protein BDF20DRAFT_471878 [Mycotypha africana]KAI8982434.1 hypothetical protein BDF20DRAFT_471878 [Mycotypha africana]
MLVFDSCHYSIICILHPSAFRLRSLPMGNDYYELLIFRKNSILSKLHSSTSLISNLHQCLKITPRLFFDFLQNSVVCLLKYDDELCSVSSPAWVETAIVSNFLTYGWMEWHANQRKVFNDNQRLTHWELYRKCQFGLWCLRIILIGCIIFNVGTYILISLLVIYVLILTIPYFLVKPSKGKWPLSLVGVSHSSFMLEDEEDDRVKGSSSLPVKLRRGGVNNHRHDSEENFENDDPMMADDMSIVQEEPSIIQQQQQQTPYFHFRQQDSDILDNIVSGFNNIKMQ